MIFLDRRKIKTKGKKGKEEFRNREEWTQIKNGLNERKYKRRQREREKERDGNTHRGGEKEKK